MTGTAAGVQPRAPATPFGRRIIALADELANVSEAPDRLTCTYLSPAHRAAAAQLQSWMRSAGLDATIDAVGNVVGFYRSPDRSAKTLIIGSHYDTVRNAGKYDGRLGILAGLVALEELARTGDRLPYHVELIAFSEEEGVRFGVPYFGSSAVAGRFDLRWLDLPDATGATVADVILAAGNNPADIPKHGRRPDDLLGYLELHIEQGPVLLEAGLPLGIVTAIAGCSRYRVAIKGVAGHAGTVPMAARHDALTAAAELVMYVERHCQRIPGLVGTVGQISVPDGAINVVPGQCELSLDIRADEAGKLDAAIADVLAEIRRIGAARGVTMSVGEIQRTPVIPCSQPLQKMLSKCVERAGIDVRYLPSGAGHDAVMFHDLTPIGMLFVRCGNGGVSHSPLESVTEEDADLAVAVLLDALKSLYGGV
jgi:allantoate deiminase/N-carbamoyl-L-amino-acid hydrolase